MRHCRHVKAARDGPISTWHVLKASFFFCPVITAFQFFFFLYVQQRIGPTAKPGHGQDRNEAQYFLISLIGDAVDRD